MKIPVILQAIQSELKAPKSQYNSFGKYKYRNCEDILEALKPILAKYEAAVTIADDVVLIGERYYIKATAILRTTDEEIAATAFAREPDEKKGMDASQITGMASSYARKYALNGLFAIDDTKDADTLNTEPKEEPKAETKYTITKDTVNGCLKYIVPEGYSYAGKTLRDVYTESPASIAIMYETAKRKGDKATEDNIRCCEDYRKQNKS